MTATLPAIGAIVRHYQGAVGRVVGLSTREHGNGLGPGDVFRTTYPVVQQCRMLASGALKEYECPTSEWHEWTVLEADSDLEQARR